MSEEHVGRIAIRGTLSFGAAFLLFFLLGLLSPQSGVLGWGREDGPVEYLGALFWGMASLVCLARLLRDRPRPMALVVFWGLLAFLSMGEEVSWFQRLLGIETPERIAAINGQGELNLHNLEWIDFGPVFNIQQVFHLGFFSYFLLLPLLMGWERAHGLATRLGYTRPHRSFLLMVWTVILGSYLLQKLGSDVAVRVIAEGRETFFAFAVLANVLFYVGHPQARAAAPISLPKPALPH